jgi:hypothetical protein
MNQNKRKEDPMELTIYTLLLGVGSGLSEEREVIS